MRCNPWRWLWGLLPLLILGWLTVKLEHPRIEADLRARTEVALKDAGLEWGETAFSGRDGRISGRALSEGQPARAVQTVRNVWGVRVADDDTDLLDKVEIYLWSAAAGDKRIKLAGFVPDQALRTQVLALVKAKFPDYAIDDRMELARGAPETGKWLAALGFGLDKLTQLKSGEVGVASLDLSVAGEAKSFSTYKAVKASLRNALPDQVKVARDKVTPPFVAPYTWSAKRSATELVLAGHVPSEAVQNQIFDYAKSRFPKLVIIDRLEIAAGAEDNAGPAYRAVLTELHDLVEGEAQATGRAIVVKGVAPDKAGAERVRAALKANVPSPFSAIADLTYPEPKPPVIAPYVTRVEMVDPDAVRVSGFVPSEDDRKSLLQRITKSLDGRRIIDELQLGSGPADGWQACVVAGVDGLKRLGNGITVLTDRALSLTGRSADEDLASALPKELRAAGNRSCDSTVDIALDLPPEPNLTWRASYDGVGEIVLEGEVPDAAAKAALADAALKSFPTARVTDRMTIAGGKSGKWTKVASSGLGLLSRLRKGQATLSGAELVLTGEAKDTSVAAAVKDQLQHTLAKGYAGRDVIEVRSDAMIWSEAEAKRKAEEEAARQSAALEARRKIDEEARRKAEEEAIAQREAEARRQAEEARRKAEEEAIAQREAEARRQAEEAARLTAERERLARIEADAQRQREEEARRKAEAEAEAAARAAAAAAAVPKAGPERAKLEAEADQCEALIKGAAASGVVRFRFASSELDEASHATLDKLAGIAKTCPRFRLLVEGHTDAEGDPDRNQALSEARAKSVVGYLQNAGLDAGRLTAVGYGETKPVAPNDTAANRARNRRIEFAVNVE